MEPPTSIRLFVWESRVPIGRKGPERGRDQPVAVIGPKLDLSQWRLSTVALGKIFSACCYLGKSPQLYTRSERASDNEGCGFHKGLDLRPTSVWYTQKPHIVDDKPRVLVCCRTAAVLDARQNARYTCATHTHKHAHTHHPYPIHNHTHV